MVRQVGTVDARAQLDVVLELALLENPRVLGEQAGDVSENGK